MQKQSHDNNLILFMPQPKYKRILLKLSGETLGKSGAGIDPVKLKAVARELESVVNLGVELGVVIGGGNLWRKRSQGKGFDPATSDYIGIIATTLNALALQQEFKARGVDVLVQSHVATEVPLIEPLNFKVAQAALRAGKIVVFAGGTGKPFFTTDTAAAQQAIAINADVIIKAGPVDGVYSADPKKFRSAKKYHEISFAEVLQKKLEVMDLSAFSLCAQYKLPIVVCQWKVGQVGRVVKGEEIGTLVKP